MVIGVLPAGEVAEAGSNSIEDDAQLLLYEINRARWNPSEFSEESGISLPASVVPRPPLAEDSDLAVSAEFKANEMADNGYFGHQSAVTGEWPNELARSAGYSLPDWWPDDANNIESLHGGSPVAFNVLGSFAGSPSHRKHIFGEGWFGGHTEIGVGRSTNQNYWAVHTAHVSEGDTFVTGVAYRDANGNGRMDLGEGLANVKVVVGDKVTFTDGGGGYEVKVPKGRHRVKATGGSFEGRSRKRVKVQGYNVRVDFVSGKGRPQIYAYETCMGKAPTLLGTEGSDVLYGTSGPDVIHGLGGRDKIYGLGGNDVICGGRGGDVIDGGGGSDRVHGQGGSDSCSSAETKKSC